MNFKCAVLIGTMAMAGAYLGVITCNLALWIVKSRTWIGLEDDYFRLFSGAVFKTEQEAKDALSLVYKKLTGREWRG